MRLGLEKIAIWLCLIWLICMDVAAFCCGEVEVAIISIPFLLLLGGILVEFPNVEQPITVSGNKVPERPFFKPTTNKQAIENHIDNLTISDTLDILDSKVEGRE